MQGIFSYSPSPQWFTKLVYLLLAVTVLIVIHSSQQSSEIVACRFITQIQLMNVPTWLNIWQQGASENSYMSRTYTPEQF